MKNPILKVDNEIYIDDCLKEEKFCNLKITAKGKFSLNQNSLFDSCEIVKLDFTKCQIKKLEFIDCKIVDCDLSNLELEETIFKRCQFIGCKMLGVNFNKITLADVLFQDCILKYSSFINVKLKDSKFAKCNCSDSSFFDTVSSKLEIDTVDFSNSNIENITTDLKSIKKITVNQEQAISLATLLDITVKI